MSYYVSDIIIIEIRRIKFKEDARAIACVSSSCISLNANKERMVFMARLTPKQEKFCQEYLKDLNATQAAKRAGYSEKTARVQSARLLSNVNIQNYIQQLRTETRNADIADIKEIQEYLSSVMRGKSQSEVVVVEAVGDGITSARGVNKSPDEKERLKAAELLGKALGMFDKRDGDNSAEAVRIVDDL